MRRAYVLSCALLSLVVMAGLAVPAGARPVARAATTSGSASSGNVYTPLLSPKSLLANKRIAGRGTLKVSVGSLVPASTTSVVFNLTPAAATQAGYLDVYAADTARPGTGNVNFVPSHPVGNLVVSRISGSDSGRAVNIYNGSPGAVSVYVAVTGYFAPSAGGSGLGTFGAVTPVRQMNSAAGVGVRKGPVGPRGQVSLKVTGSTTGIPAGASAVVINLIAAQATKPGLLTAYSDDDPRPAYATMNYTTGSPVDHLAIVPVSAAGTITIYNYSAGSVQLYGDVFGYFADGDPTDAGALGTLAPYRVSSAKIGARKTVTLPTAGRGGVPKSGVASVALNLHVTDAAGRGYLTVNPSSPITSSMNFNTGQSIANLTVSKVDSDGQVKIFNGSSAAISVAVDVTGYTLSNSVTVPPTSRSHYIRVTSASQLAQAGHDDADAGSKFVVLDLGAQTNDMSGVELSATATRINYAQTVDLVKDYVDAYAQENADAAVTVAVATNNDGDFGAYHAVDRGADWAKKVIIPARANAAEQSGISIVAANDIEPGGSSTEAQAQNWETYFLSAMKSQGSSGLDLYFIGSADGCPTLFGLPGHSCAYGWTEAQLYELAGGSGPDAARIQALPQIYYGFQTRQWANIAATGGSVATFDGSLTEHGTCPSASTSGCSGLASVTAPQGFAALYHGLSTVARPSMKYATDLDIID